MEINIKTDSRKVKKGDIFIALKCANNDGHDYIEDAIRNGASKIFVNNDYYNKHTKEMMPNIDLFHNVENTHSMLVNYLKTNYYDLIKDIKLIGITGTNGKTTTAYLIYQGLNILGENTAYIGTIGAYLKEEVITLNNTTPDILELYNILLLCKEKEIDNVVMEVSSHALELNRVDSLEYDVGIFTNLTQDHLDYHGNMTKYATSKSYLFDKLKNKKTAIINNDSEYKELMIKDNNYNITYGFNKSIYQIINYNVSKDMTKFEYLKGNNNYIVNSPLLGKHNVYNLLTMIILLKEKGVNDKTINEIIPKIKAPKGRMEKINYNKNTIIVDYAHTPDAISNTLNAIKEFSNGKIYSIIGCGGNRDKSKREVMANTTCENSDVAIFTSDNPRMENPIDIIEDMIKSIKHNNYIIYPDRKCAIKKGIDLLDKDDTLVIMGKGHEDYQIIGTEKKYHDDMEYVKQLIKKR